MKFACVVVLLLVVFIVLGDGYDVLLYNTQDSADNALEYYDCINYVNDGEQIPYCRRPGKAQKLNRISTNEKCDNDGEIKYFKELLEQDATPRDLLDWGLSVELADDYAAIFYNQHTLNEENRFVCICTRRGTFGKRCEYLLTHQSNSFIQAIQAQFNEKEIYPWGTQSNGTILCYETLNCSSGHLCLDWRDICNGDQQCIDGRDEENCDKLEFNECNNGEFRCDNGMCIPEEYWLDGDFDCMDWTDEYPKFFNGEWCSSTPNRVDCDEHLCVRAQWSCGDGHCIDWQDRLSFQTELIELYGCNNYRHLNYMCEVSPEAHLWTLNSGLCCSKKGYDDPKLDMHNSQLSNEEKCIYLIRCALSQGFERDCPCNGRNCSKVMPSVCLQDTAYSYPEKALIRPYMIAYYKWNRDWMYFTPDFFVVLGSIKCRGYHISMNGSYIIRFDTQWTTDPWTIDAILCFGRHGTVRDYQSYMQYDAFCWNNSLTFNNRPYAFYDICNISRECISQYRIKDGSDDCTIAEDEIISLTEDLCSNLRKDRFRCGPKEHSCLSHRALGNSRRDCSSNNDENYYSTGSSLRETKCHMRDDEGCQLLRNYIRSSSLEANSTVMVNISSKSIGRMPFRWYCDGAWDMQKHADEFPESCSHWVCRQDQYQCQTGQCIDLKWVCDGEWDCADASDEEAIVLIKEWSPHNAQLADSNKLRQMCRKRYSNQPFWRICDQSEEFPCYLANVSHPLDIKKNRPCIDLTQIGDGIENCYNAYDEKNTFETVSGRMWGLSLRCNNRTLPNTFACNSADFECAEVLCSYRRNQNKNGSCSNVDDTICIDNNQCKTNTRCDGIQDCWHSDDEYWCLPSLSAISQEVYRYHKIVLRRDPQQMSFLYSTVFPAVNHAVELNRDVQIVDKKQDEDDDSSLYEYSFVCQRGLAVKSGNSVLCLCPPAYYGHLCQYFSDRLTIVTHLDVASYSNGNLPQLFKVKTNFLFNSCIIDHHEFVVHPVRTLDIKHKFYLLYSRSTKTLKHKRKRYLNRTDIVNNHPYSVHFDIYALDNSSIVELGSWHYLIYFDYLPSFRLAIILKFPMWFGNSSLDPCLSNGCNNNSNCMPLFNSPSNKSFYCSCKSGYYGDNCQYPDGECQRYCSDHSLCRRGERGILTNADKPYCICPLGHFGPRCNLPHDECKSSSCLNDGTCFETYDPSGHRPFVCLCSRLFYGDRCQYDKMPIRIVLNTTIHARASVIQFYDIDNISFELVLKYQQVIDGLPSIIRYDHGRSIAPVLAVLKTHHAESTDTTEYFILYIQPNVSIVNLTSSPRNCPHALTLMQMNDDLRVPSVFKYHHICRNNSILFCFYDSNYLCICQSDHYRVECFEHDLRLDQCHNCLSSGKCVKGDLNNDTDFLCICPRCHQGQRCEISMEAFGFTLDSLLVDSTRATEIIYLTLASFLFTIGLFNNICSFVTFQRPIPRGFAVGNYLLLVSCLNQISLLSLLGKLLRITLRASDQISCKTVSYLLSVFNRSTYWLTSWITLNRLHLAMFQTSRVFKNSPVAAVFSSIVTLIALFSMHLHELLYYRTIQDLSSNTSICVINLQSDFVRNYNRINSLGHYLVPFFIQIISITLLIILIARSRAKTAGKKVIFTVILKKQFRTQKELYIMPTIIILSCLPQAIVTFSFACKIQLNDWQRHTLLGTYLLTFCPQVLGFILHVLPSSTYRKEFSATPIGKKLFYLMFRDNN